MADRMKSGGDFCSAILCTKPETKQKAVLVNRFPDSQKMKKGKCLIWFVNSINPCTRQTYTFVLMFSELCLGLESRMTNEKWMAKDRIDRKKDVIKIGWSEICTAFSKSRGLTQHVLRAFCSTSNNVFEMIMMWMNDLVWKTVVFYVQCSQYSRFFFYGSKTVLPTGCNSNCYWHKRITQLTSMRFLQQLMIFFLANTSDESFGGGSGMYEISMYTISI